MDEKEAAVRQSIVNNLAALVKRRIEARPSGKQIMADDVIISVMRGIADGKY